MFHILKNILAPRLILDRLFGVRRLDPVEKMTLQRIDRCRAYRRIVGRPRLMPPSWGFTPDGKTAPLVGRGINALLQPRPQQKRRNP